MSETLDLFARRQGAIQDEIAALKERLATLEKEANRIRVAEQVVRDLMATNTDAMLTAVTEIEASKAEAAVTRTKPDGIPPMPTMILEALGKAHERGVPGLQPLGIASYIRGKYWPQAEIASIGPIAWRMWKRDQLGKDDSLYYLPDREHRYPLDGNKTAPAQGAEAGRDDAERELTPRSVLASELFG